MESRYEVKPSRVGRRPDRRLPAIVATGAVIAMLVIAKPWQNGVADRPATSQASPGGSADLGIPSSEAGIGSDRFEPVVVAAAPAPWPAGRNPAVHEAAGATEALGALGMLRVYAGTWGVGAVGVGPRLVRDEPWADWTPAVGEAVGDGPRHMAIWPGTSVCSGFPAIYDRPSIVALSGPATFIPVARVRAWWTDGATFANIDDSIRRAAADVAGMGFVERIDRAPWPPGRYEFHLSANGEIAALTVCLTRGG